MFANHRIFFLPRGTLTKACTAVLERNIIKHGGTVVKTPELATIAITGKTTEQNPFDPISLPKEFLKKYPEKKINCNVVYDSWISESLMVGRLVEIDEHGVHFRVSIPHNFYFNH